MDMPCTCPDSTSTTSMSNMPVVFFTSITTPLYSLSWTPSSTGWYAATCIFLIIFAAVYRFLNVYRARREHGWTEKESSRQIVIANTADFWKNGEESKSEEESNIWTKIKFKVLHDRPSARPWRNSEDIPRAFLDVLVAGVGYLLMLAVMTLNVGYFMSILGGTFLGSVLFGRYAHSSDQGSKSKKSKRFST